MKPLVLLRVLVTILPFQIRNRFSVTFPRVERFVRAVRETEAQGVGEGTGEGMGVGLGVAGYCWGGKHVTVLSSLSRDDGVGRKGEKRTLIDAAFTAHPGGLSLPTDIANLRAPWSMTIGDDDFVMSVDEVEKVKGALLKKSAGEGGEGVEGVEERSEVVVYPGAKHGFAVRGNPGDERDRRRGVEAREQCLSWLGRWFGRAG